MTMFMIALDCDCGCAWKERIAWWCTPWMEMEKPMRLDDQGAIRGGDSPNRVIRENATGTTSIGHCIVNDPEWTRTL